MNCNYKPVISIRLALYTELGPVGPRLARDEALPDFPNSFPDNEEGRIQAEEARKAYQDYIKRNYNKQYKE